MFEIQIYSATFFLLSGFLIAAFYQKKRAKNQIWKTISEPLMTLWITGMGFIFTAATVQQLESEIFGCIATLIVCHLVSTPFWAEVSLQKLSKTTTRIVVSIVLCAAAVLAFLAAFRLCLPVAGVSIHPLLKTWLVLYSIGALSVVLTSALIRTYKQKERVRWGLQIAVDWLRKVSNRLGRKADSCDTRSPASFLPGQTYSAIDANFWHELAEQSRLDKTAI